MRSPIDAFHTLLYTVADYTLGTAIVVVHGLREKRSRGRRAGIDYGSEDASNYGSDYGAGATGESELGVRHLH